MLSSPSGFLVAALLLFSAGCAHHGPFVWVDDLPEKRGAAAEGEYVIRPGDSLSVRVFGQEGMSGRTRVRPDGHISVPFLNDVLAAGLTPNELAAQIQGRLKNFVNNPVVTVSLEETPPLQIAIVGEVARPGTFALTQGTGVLDVIAHAGGLTDYADPEGIFVLRRNPKGETQRIRFRYDDLRRAQGRAAEFRLQPSDVVVVE